MPSLPAILTLLCVVCTAAEPLLLQDDMEDAIVWKGSSSPALVDGAHGRCLRIANATAGSTFFWRPVEPTLVAGRSVELSAMVAGTAVAAEAKPGRGAKLALRLLLADGSVRWCQVPLPSGSWAWRRSASTFVIPAEVSEVRCFLGLEAASGDLLIDDVELRQVDPSALAKPPGAAPRIQAVPLMVRGGLPNVAAKLQRGGPVTVVCIGGSITVGGGQPAGHVTRLGEWLRQAYPAAEVRMVNAGIGGTDSAFGAKRFDRDVLAAKPDLVLIEFCVNDGVRDMSEHVERMLRKTWEGDPATDIAIYFTLHRDHLSSYAEGILPPAAAWHDRVADHYGIPTLNPALAAAVRIAAGSLPWLAFSADATHPTAAGYGIYAEAFAAALPRLLAAGKPGPHALPPSLTPGLVVRPVLPPAETLPAADLRLPGGGTAAEAHRLPVAGRHWRGEADFTAADGRALWRIGWMPRPRLGGLQLDCAARPWERTPAVWFAEDACFTGLAGMAVLRASGQASAFGADKASSGVLRFVAPVAGRWQLHVSASGLRMWQGEARSVALDVLRQGWDGAPPTRILRVEGTVRELAATGFARDAACDLAPGEELVLVPSSDAPAFIDWSFEGFDAVVARLP